MNPIEFKEQSRTLGKPAGMTDEQCGSLPIWNEDYRTCVSCWQPSFWERLKILLGANIWLGIYSGYTQPPVWVRAEHKFWDAMTEEIPLKVRLNRVASFFPEIKIRRNNDSLRAWIEWFFGGFWYVFIWRKNHAPYLYRSVDATPPGTENGGHWFFGYTEHAEGG